MACRAWSPRKTIRSRKASLGRARNAPGCPALLGTARGDNSSHLGWSAASCVFGTFRRDGHTSAGVGCPNASQRRTRRSAVALGQTAPEDVVQGARTSAGGATRSANMRQCAVLNARRAQRARPACQARRLEKTNRGRDVASSRLEQSWAAATPSADIAISEPDVTAAARSARAVIDLIIGAAVVGTNKMAVGIAAMVLKLARQQRQPR